MSRSTFAWLSLVVLFAAPAVVRAEEAAPAAAAQAPAPTGVMIADIRGETVPIFTYGSWQDRINRSPDGVIVAGSRGAQGSGGLFASLATPLDLTGMTHVDVALAVGQGNEVPEITVAFNDADGTAASVRIRIDQIMPGQPVWFRVPISSLRADTGERAGKVAGFDAAHIKEWHLQGDWTTKKPVQVMFIALRARR